MNAQLFTPPLKRNSPQLFWKLIFGESRICWQLVFSKFCFFFNNDFKLKNRWVPRPGIKSVSRPCRLWWAAPQGRNTTHTKGTGHFHLAGWQLLIAHQRPLLADWMPASPPVKGIVQSLKKSHTHLLLWLRSTFAVSLFWQPYAMSQHLFPSRPALFFGQDFVLMTGESNHSFSLSL